MRQIKFRVWHNKDKYWVHPPGKEVNLFGEMILLGGFMPVKVEELNDCIPLQFTGLIDKKKIEVYEENILKIKYRVGDFAWDQMTEKEIEENQKMEGKSFICVVKWIDYVGGFSLIYGDLKSTHTQFPMTCCVNGEIIGNTMENPELVDKKL